ncbi:hypothetical protein M2133_001233 [Parabacteroides sp. PF5-6]|nr:hypothetical protein [Parabacteroides sp. PF5-6]
MKNRYYIKRINYFDRLSSQKGREAFHSGSPRGSPQWVFQSVCTQMTRIMRIGNRPNRCDLCAKASLFNNHILVDFAPGSHFDFSLQELLAFIAFIIDITFTLD